MKLARNENPTGQRYLGSVTTRAGRRELEARHVSHDVTVAELNQAGRRRLGKQAAGTLAVGAALALGAMHTANREDHAAAVQSHITRHEAEGVQRVVRQNEAETQNAHAAQATTTIQPESTMSK